MPLLRLLAACAGVLFTAVVLAGCTTGEGQATCDLDEFFSYKGKEYILGDMVASGKLVTCSELISVGKGYVRDPGDVGSWDCGVEPTGAEGTIYLSCVRVRDCSRIDLVVIGLGPEGLERSRPELPLKCGPKLEPFDEG